MAENQHTRTDARGYPRPRRVIQITACGDNHVVALCDDGTIWEYRFSDASGGERGTERPGWWPYPRVPGTEP